jgi:cytidylate kinase
MSVPVIAVDGPTASGKGTLARCIAAALDFAHLDTGTLYRAVAAKLLEAGESPDDADAATRAAEVLVAEDLDRADLRQESVSQAASRVARLSPVRAALLEFQRRFAHRPPGGKGGAVLDGRDIGTVVCPDAEVKLFITASAEVRAMRRHRELLDRGEGSIYARVLQDLEERDARDSGRAVAPLKAAPDAVVIDTSEMDIDTAVEAAMAAVAEVLET